MFALPMKVELRRATCHSTGGGEEAAHRLVMTWRCRGGAVAVPHSLGSSHRSSVLSDLQIPSQISQSLHPHVQGPQLHSARKPNRVDHGHSHVLKLDQSRKLLLQEEGWEERREGP